MQVEQDEVGIALFSCGNGAVGVGGRGDDPVTRIVLDEILERFRQLLVVLDHQDPEHRESPRTHEHSHRKNRLKIRDLMLARNGPRANPP